MPEPPARIFDHCPDVVGRAPIAESISSVVRILSVRTTPSGILQLKSPKRMTASPKARRALRSRRCNGFGDGIDGDYDENEEFSSVAACRADSRTRRSPSSKPRGERPSPFECRPNEMNPRSRLLAAVPGSVEPPGREVALGRLSSSRRPRIGGGAGAGRNAGASRKASPLVRGSSRLDQAFRRATACY
ncbi:hypothetical protein EVAR_38919_1 [Eumeta japonica]|uniref:Uncharacterized protein n=1 Tax=Eumeta variegata TaxID=151549 RepID=A0A4C1ZTC6_EUMVA|nr:hypothetical protein EVAR_38919_1 [Eumeta japonica]